MFAQFVNGVKSTLIDGHYKSIRHSWDITFEGTFKFYDHSIFQIPL